LAEIKSTADEYNSLILSKIKVNIICVDNDDKIFHSNRMLKFDFIHARAGIDVKSIKLHIT
jgi:hypothetical protein